MLAAEERSCGVIRVDAHVLRGEIGGPEAALARPQTEVDMNRQIALFQVFMGRVFIKARRDAAPAADLEVAERNVDPRGIDGYAGVADGSEYAAPIGITTRPCGLDQGRVGNGAGYAQGVRIGQRSADVQLDHMLNTFSVLHDAHGER